MSTIEQWVGAIDVNTVLGIIGTAITIGTIVFSFGKLWGRMSARMDATDAKIDGVDESHGERIDRLEGKLMNGDFASRFVSRAECDASSGANRTLIERLEKAVDCLERKKEA